MCTALSILKYSFVFLLVSDDKPPCGPQEGEFSIVSIENRPWIAAGVVSISTQKEICILLERFVRVDIRLRLG